MSDRFTYARAKAAVLRSANGSTSHLARKLGFTYNEAAELMQRLERQGVVTAPNPSGQRAVLHPANDRS